MGRLHNSPKKNPLARKSGGGVLSAAEKRRRMLEAGKRFVMKSVRHFSPARISGKASFQGASSSRLALLRENSVLNQFAGSHAKVSLKKLSPRFPVPVLPPAIKEKPDATSSGCEEEVFRKDDNSISEILNHRPISRSTGRPSLVMRQSRPSLFPNGVNPVDQAMLRLSAKKPVPPEKPIRTFKETGLGNVSAAGEVKVENGITPSGKTPGKSVRFADNVLEKSPASSVQQHDALVKEWSQLLDNVSDLQLKEIVKALPKESLQRLYSVVVQVESEARGRGAKRSLFFVNKCSTISEDDDSGETFENEESTSQMLSASLTPVFYNTRRRSASGVKANEEGKPLAEVKPSEEQENAGHQQPKDPLFSLLGGTPRNAFRPNLDTPLLTFGRSPYNLRNSPANVTNARAVSEPQ